MTEASSLEDLTGGKNSYDPSQSDSEELDETDMAQTMGFSNFGSKPKPKSKKRKREEAQLAASGPGFESGSGSNTVPLGNPHVIPIRIEEGAEGSRDRDENASPGESLTKGDPNRPRPTYGQPEEAGSQPPLGDPAGTSAFGNQQAPSSGEGGHSQPNLHALRKGIVDQNGDIAYYDARFVEDPWKNLR